MEDSSISTDSGGKDIYLKNNKILILNSIFSQEFGKVAINNSHFITS
ncbi:MAG: hypothetical protein KID00_10115 [Clostridium argentinense]|uniref:Uncharacterized protein n=1 Tax=Clostridium faecium TaxID=2762223 RepID=A0ABR8YX79_9CLOT|nr:MULTISPECIES: hypothetical protein [Clostridium]MBD8048891.1 hypothetical protein [Clostridium faecium]MBS5824197.1 hypothetical protein [Clostridium argentinense]MDU1350806.1 hypothetical protein [Clostridium argentinense]